jgi:hypothetical protein
MDELGDIAARLATLVYDRDEAELYAAAVDPETATTDWWEHAYPGGPPVGPELIRPLYFPGNPAGKPPSKDGPDVEAVKRAIWRGGRWQGPASRFDDAYSRGFALGCGGNVVDTGLAGFQRQSRIQATGQMDGETYQTMRYARVPEGLPHAGEPLFDELAVTLLHDAKQLYDEAVAADDPELVRAAIADYCQRSLSSEPKIHYEQERPIACFGVPPEQGFTTDCSGHSTSAYYWARDSTGIAVPDPNGRSFDGYGYTGTLINNPPASSPYQVGDLAIYGTSYANTTHVTTCLRAGDASASGWCSHGSEEAPYAVGLHYRSDLIEVVRPRLIP